VQDVDGVAHVQALAEPVRHRGPRVEDKAVRIVSRSKRLQRVAGQRGRRRDLGYGLAVRTTESKLTVGVSLDLVALVMDGAVVSAT
jgi:hypothetical protein